MTRAGVLGVVVVISHGYAQDCTWTAEPDKFAGGIAGGGKQVFYSELVAKRKCLELGKGVCTAVTCDDRRRPVEASCNMRASLTLVDSKDGETTYQTDCLSTQDGTTGTGSADNGSSEGGTSIGMIVGIVLGALFLCGAPLCFIGYKKLDKLGFFRADEVPGYRDSDGTSSRASPWKPFDRKKKKRQPDAEQGMESRKSVSAVTPSRSALKKKIPPQIVEGLPQEDPYDVLGLNKDADLAAVQRAYAKLASQLQPDCHGNPEVQQQLARIQHAYETLRENSLLPASGRPLATKIGGGVAQPQEEPEPEEDLGRMRAGSDPSGNRKSRDKEKAASNSSGSSDTPSKQRKKAAKLSAPAGKARISSPKKKGVQFTLDD